MYIALSCLAALAVLALAQVYLAKRHGRKAEAHAGKPRVLPGLADHV